MPLDGRCAVITGASRGIGEAIARAMSAAGASVVVNSSGSSLAGQAVADALTDATYCCADVSDPHGAQRLVHAALRRFGRLDIVVNCAGVSQHVPFDRLWEVGDDLWRRCLDLHLLGTWNVVREAAPALRDTDSGSVINITSVAGSTVSGSSIPYSVSKAGADHLTRLLARALAPRIRVNAVAPGFIKTGLTDSLPPYYREKYTKSVPLQRTGTPSDVGSACVFLAESRTATGTVVTIDGGFHLR